MVPEQQLQGDTTVASILLEPSSSSTAWNLRDSTSCSRVPMLAVDVILSRLDALADDLGILYHFGNLSQSEIMSKCVYHCVIISAVSSVYLWYWKSATNDDSNVEERLALSVLSKDLSHNFFFEDPLYAVFGLGTDGLWTGRGKTLMRDDDVPPSQFDTSHFAASETMAIKK